MEAEFEDSNNNLLLEKSPAEAFAELAAQRFKQSMDDVHHMQQPMDQDESIDHHSGEDHMGPEDHMGSGTDSDDLAHHSSQMGGPTDDSEHGPSYNEDVSFEDQVVGALQRHAAQMAAQMAGRNTSDVSSNAFDALGGLSINSQLSQLSQLNQLSQLSQLNQLNSLLAATGNNHPSAVVGNGAIVSGNGAANAVSLANGASSPNGSSLLSNLAQQWNPAALAALGSSAGGLAALGQALSGGLAGLGSSSAPAPAHLSSPVSSTANTPSGGLHTSASSGNGSAGKTSLNGSMLTHVEAAKGYTFEEQFKQVRTLFRLFACAASRVLFL
jgi:hypothetical protein